MPLHFIWEIIFSRIVWIEKYELTINELSYFWNEYRSFPELIKHELLWKNEGLGGRYTGKPWLLSSVRTLSMYLEAKYLVL